MEVESTGLALAKLIPAIRGEIKNNALSDETRTSLNLLGITDEDIERLHELLCDE